MVAAANLVEVAALVGDTARATMLAALMGGQALTPTELAFLALISPPTASEHLAKLVEARLITVAKQGRFRYYRIESPRVAHMLESIIAVAAIDVPPRFRPRSARDDALRFARTCYDHLAGRLGVAIADALTARQFLVLTEDGGALTETGSQALTAFGLDLVDKSGGRRVFCRACLDWSERRFHIGGFVGVQIWHRCLALRWVERERDSRAVRLTSAGKAGLYDTFGIALVDEEHEPARVIPAPRLAKGRTRVA
jgi:DNA-binding transcriptional ArsR family regulator